MMNSDMFGDCSVWIHKMNGSHVGREGREKLGRFCDARSCHESGLRLVSVYCKTARETIKKKFRGIIDRLKTEKTGIIGNKNREGRKREGFKRGRIHGIQTNGR